MTKKNLKRAITLADLDTLQQNINNNFDNRFINLKKKLNSRFDNMEQTFFNWKSELFSKIDNDYATPIKAQTEDTAALTVLGFPALT